MASNSHVESIPKDSSVGAGEPSPLPSGGVEGHETSGSKDAHLIVIPAQSSSTGHDESDDNVCSQGIAEESIQVASPANNEDNSKLHNSGCRELRAFRKHRKQVKKSAGNGKPSEVINVTNFAEREIRNIMYMKDREDEVGSKRLLHLTALEEWTAKINQFTTRVEKKKKQSSSIRNEVYQLVSFYSVFQGVLLTAVAQSNLLHCNNLWAAITLSVLASFVTVIGVFQKFEAILDLEKTIESEAITRSQLVGQLQHLKLEGADFSFEEHVKKREDSKASGEGASKSGSPKWKPTIIAVIVALLLFSATFVVASQRILCDPGHSKLPAAT